MRRIVPAEQDLERLFRHGDQLAAPDCALDLSVPLNPWARQPGWLAALREYLFRQPAWLKYPDPQCAVLRERLAEKHGLSPQQIVVGNGANELIYALARALRPRCALFFEPTYTEYLRACRQVGARTLHWLAGESDQFTPQPVDLRGVDLVWVCQPNNPTGYLWPRERLRAWIAAERKTIFVVDEAFLPFRADEESYTLAPWCQEYDHLVVLRSLTKLYGLAGLRLGYAVLPAARAAQVQAQLVPWSVNALAQQAGCFLLEQGGPLVAHTRRWLQTTLEPFQAALRRLAPRLQVVPSQANFVLVRLEHGSATALCQQLAARGIALRPAGNFLGLDDRYLRIALGTPAEQQQLLEQLAQVVHLL
jgi:threonine-phosphate decarboxylase